MLRKVHQIQKAGSIKNLKLIEESISDPEDFEVQIEVYFVGLNFADIFALTGLYSATPQGSFIPGLEFSGVITKLGKKVKSFKLRQKVMGVTRFGAYSTHLNVSFNNIYPLPPKWNLEEGASFLVQGITAYYALIELGNLKKEQTVLIHSAAGGVGILAGRIAKKLEAYTIGTIGDSNKKEFLIKDGYDQVLVRDKNYKNSLKESLREKKLNLILESIGGSVFTDSLNQLSPTGRMIVYGSANFTPSSSSPNPFTLLKNYITRPKIDPLKMISENKSVMAFNLIWLWDQIYLLKNFTKRILDLKIKPPHVGKIFSFEEAIQALEYFKSGKSIGKILLKVK